MYVSRATFAITDAAETDAQSRTHPERGGMHLRQIVVIAVEQDESTVERRALIGDGLNRPRRGETERPHDADLIDLRRARPPDSGRLHPRRRARSDLGPAQLRHELGIPQPLGHSTASTSGIHHCSSHGDRSGECTPTDLVQRDDQLALAEEPALESQLRRDDGHSGAGTPLKIS